MVSEDAQIILAFLALANASEDGELNPSQTLANIQSAVGNIVASPAIMPSLAELEDARLVVSALVANSLAVKAKRRRQFRITTEGSWYALTNEREISQTLGRRSAHDRTLLRRFQDLSAGVGANVLDDIRGLPVPASDRYVSVADNSDQFAGLLKSLTVIRDQFKADHNKGEIPDSTKTEVLRQIAEFEAEATDGYIKRSSGRSLLFTLERSLKALEPIALKIAGVLGAIDMAVAALRSIFRL